MLKGFLIRAFLKKITDGDTGSTILGAIAAALLAGNINWGEVTKGMHDQASATEIGKVIGIVVLAVWGYFTGKKTGPKNPSGPPATAALAH
jgi:hypothetical protein